MITPKQMRGMTDLIVTSTEEARVCLECPYPESKCHGNRDCKRIQNFLKSQKEKNSVNEKLSHE